MVMKIGLETTDQNGFWFTNNYDYSYPDHFSFETHTGPLRIDAKVQQKWDFNKYGGKGPYGYIAYGGLDKRSIVFDAVFTSRDQVDELNKYLFDTRIKKIYYQDDRFILGFINEPKWTRDGKRPLLWDYFAEFFCFDPYYYSDTLKTATDSSGIMTLTNAGNTNARPAFKIDVTSGPVTSFNLKDDEGRVFYWDDTGDGGAATTGTTFYIVPYYKYSRITTGGQYIKTIYSFLGTDPDTRFGTCGKTIIDYPVIQADTTGTIEVYNVTGGTISVTAYLRDTYL